MKPNLYAKPPTMWAAPRTHYRVDTLGARDAALTTEDGDHIGSVFIQSTVPPSHGLVASIGKETAHYFIS